MGELHLFQILVDMVTLTFIPNLQAEYLVNPVVVLVIFLVVHHSQLKKVVLKKHKEVVAHNNNEVVAEVNKEVVAEVNKVGVAEAVELLVAVHPFPIMVDMVTLTFIPKLQAEYLLNPVVVLVVFLVVLKLKKKINESIPKKSKRITSE